MSADYLGQLLDIGSQYVKGQVRVSLKTNFGPAIPIYSGSAGAPSSTSENSGIWSLIGLKAGVIVTDAEGHVLASYGGQPETDRVRAGIVLGLVAIGALVAIRAVVKKHRKK